MAFILFSAVTKWFILEYHVVSEIYVQEQQVNTGRTGIFLSAFDNSVQVPELNKQNLLAALLFSDTMFGLILIEETIKP